MPRQKRVDEAGVCYHAINRGNARQEIFHKPQDYEAFLRVLSQRLEKYAVELFSFSLMPNHRHLVLRPQKNGQMGSLMRWVTATHSLRLSLCRAQFAASKSGYKSRGMALRIALSMESANRATSENPLALAHSTVAELESTRQ